MVMKSIFSTPGKTTMPTQPAVQTTASGVSPGQNPASPFARGGAMDPNAATRGTYTPATNNSWQRGTRGMDRVKMPGVTSYAPQQPKPPITSGIGYVTDPSTRTQGGAAPTPTGDTSTWTPADWARYNTFHEPAAIKSPTWNGKPVQTGAYVAPSWKQPVAPPPAAVAPPPPAPPPPSQTPPATTTTPWKSPSGYDSITELMDQMPGMPLKWYQDMFYGPGGVPSSAATTGNDALAGALAGG